MAATDLNALLRVPGRLVINPTDITQAFPYGGTSLGLVRDIVAMPGQEQEDLVEENLGVTVVASIDLGQKWAITASVRALEQGTSASLGFTTETGAQSGEAGIVYNPVSNAAGAVISTVGLLFAPLDELEHWFVWIPAAIAKPQVAAKIAKTAGAEGGLAYAFKASPRSSDGVAVRWKKKEDLVLS